MPAKKLTFSVRFFLRETIIYIRVTVNGRREDWSTQRRCERGQWDARANRMVGSKARGVNDWLDALFAKAHEFRQELFAGKKEITALNIRKLMQGEELEPARMVSEAWDYHFAYIIGLIGKDYTKATLVKYRSGYKAFKSFTKDIRLDELDHAFIKAYEFYLKTDYGVQNNTAIQHVKRLRTVVRIAMDLGWLKHDPFIAHRMKATETHRDYLTGAELSDMATRKFNKRLSAVRDLFLFSCYTGLAYVDTAKLTENDLVIGEDGETWLQTHRQKNNNYVRVPLLAPAKTILQQYNNTLPKISNQKANAYLKEIASQMKLPKNLTFHCARHTFATTVTLTNGVPIETVGQMLGHKKLATTQLYARVTDTKVKTDMQPLLDKFNTQSPAGD